MFPSTEMTLARVSKEFEEFQSNPPIPCTVVQVNGDILHWEISFKGPPLSPYESRQFQLTVHFPKGYPFNPPQLSIIPYVSHPKVRGNSSVLNAVSDGWTASARVSMVLQMLTRLLENDHNIRVGPQKLPSRPLGTALDNDGKGKEQVR